MFFVFIGIALQGLNSISQFDSRWKFVNNVYDLKLLCIFAMTLDLQK